MKLSNLISLLMLIPNLSQAALCNSYTEKVEDPFYYFDSMLSILANLNKETVKLRNTDEKNDYLYELTTAMPRMKCTLEEIAPFMKAKNSQINKSANMIAESVNKLFSAFQGQIDLVKAAENGDIKGSSLSIRRGELTNSFENGWDLLTLSIVESTYVLVDPKDSKALLITSKQKSILIKKIEKNYITKDKVKYKIEGTMIGLISMLKEKWKTAK